MSHDNALPDLGESAHIFASGDTPAIASLFSDLLKTAQTIWADASKRERTWAAEFWHSVLWFGVCSQVGLELDQFESLYEPHLAALSALPDLNKKWTHGTRQVVHYWGIDFFHSSRRAGVNLPIRPSSNFCVELRKIAQTHTLNEFAAQLLKVLEEHFHKARRHLHDKAQYDDGTFELQPAHLRRYIDTRITTRNEHLRLSPPPTWPTRASRSTLQFDPTSPSTPERARCARRSGNIAVHSPGQEDSFDQVDDSRLSVTRGRAPELPEDFDDGLAAVFADVDTDILPPAASAHSDSGSTEDTWLTISTLDVRDSNVITIMSAGSSSAGAASELTHMAQAGQLVPTLAAITRNTSGFNEIAEIRSLAQRAQQARDRADDLLRKAEADVQTATGIHHSELEEKIDLAKTALNSKIVLLQAMEALHEKIASHSEDARQVQGNLSNVPVYRLLTVEMKSLQQHFDNVLTAFKKLEAAAEAATELTDEASGLEQAAEQKQALLQQSVLA